MNKRKSKIFVKKKIKDAALKYLMNEKSDKNKVKDIKYSKLEIQRYIYSNLFRNYEVELLHKIRSRNLDLKCNFKTKFTKGVFGTLPNNTKCSIDGCDNELEDQPHLMECAPILNIFNQKYNLPSEINLKYEHIFSSSVKKQSAITKFFSILIDIREKLLSKQQQQQQH